MLRAHTFQFVSNESYTSPSVVVLCISHTAHMLYGLWVRRAARSMNCHCMKKLRVLSTFALIHTFLDKFVDKFSLFTRTCCFFKENINSFVVDAHHKCHMHIHYSCLNEVFWFVCR